MRRLAQELGVEAMSLYYYVKDKAELLSGIVDLVLHEVQPTSAGKDWKRAIRRSAISLHDALLRHRWSTRLMMTGAVSWSRLRYMDALLGRLHEAGFSDSTIDLAYHALDSHIFGSTLWAGSYGDVARRDPAFGQRVIAELAAGELPHLRDHAEQHFGGRTKGVRAQFEFGLDLILDGLERVRARRRRTPR